MAMRSIGLGAAVVVFGVVAVGAPAAAHESVVSTSPGEDATVETLPPDVSITYTAEPLDVSSEIVVSDASKRVWSSSGVRREDATLIQKLNNLMPSGTYEVRWRTVSQDGHLISDVFEFTVGSNAGAAPTAAASPTPTAVDAEARERSDAWRVPAIATALVLLIAFVAAFVRRDRRQGDVDASETH